MFCFFQPNGHNRRHGTQCSLMARLELFLTLQLWSLRPSFEKGEKTAFVLWRSTRNPSSKLKLPPPLMCHHRCRQTMRPCTFHFFFFFLFFTPQRATQTPSAAAARSYFCVGGHAALDVEDSSKFQRVMIQFARSHIP